MDSFFLKVWDTIAMFACLCSSYMYMYDAAFTQTEEDAYEDNYLLFMTIIFESFFIIDLILKFFTEIKSDSL